MRPLNRLWSSKKSIFTLKFYNNITKTGAELQRLSKKYRNLQYLLFTNWQNRFKMSPNKPPTIMMSEAKSYISKRVFPEFQKIKWIFLTKTQCVCELSSFLVYFICIKVITVKLWGPRAQRPWRRCATCAKVNLALSATWMLVGALYINLPHWMQ